MKKSTNQIKMTWILTNMEIVNCPNQLHCGICWVHIIVYLFRIWQIIWKWMKNKHQFINFNLDKCYIHNWLFTRRSKNMAKYFSGVTIMSVIIVLQKGNTSIISLLILYENRNNMKSKALSSMVYWIMENLFLLIIFVVPKQKFP